MIVEDIWFKHGTYCWLKLKKKKIPKFQLWSRDLLPSSLWTSQCLELPGLEENPNLMRNLG